MSLKQAQDKNIKIETAIKALRKKHALETA